MAQRAISWRDLLASAEIAAPPPHAQIYSNMSRSSMRGSSEAGMVRRASMELGLEGTLSIMERRPSQETPSKSKSAPARSRVTPARKPSLTRRSSEIRKELLPPGIAGDVVGAMLGCVAAVQKCMPAPPPPPPPSPRLARQPSAPATVAIPASAPATPRGATPSRESALAPSPKRKPSNGSAAASLKAATAAAGVLARQRWKKAQLTVVAARGFGGGRFNQTLVRDPSSGRIVHAPEGGAPAAAETPKKRRSGCRSSTTPR